MKLRIKPNYNIIFKTLFYNELNQRLLKFCITGGLSTILNYAFFIYLYKVLEFHYLLSSISGYIIGLFFGYFLNKNWTFSTKVIEGKRYISKYITAQLLGLASNQITLLFLVEIMYLNPLFANILSLGFAAIISFILIEFIVFYKMKT